MDERRKTAERLLQHIGHSQSADLLEAWRFIVATAIASLFSIQTAVYWFGVMIEPLSHATGWSRAIVGGWMSVGLISSALLGLPLGMLIDRTSARAVIIISIILNSVGLASIGLVEHSVAAFYIAAVAVYGSVTGAIVGIARLINSRFDTLRGTVLGISAAGASVAAIVMPRFMQGIVDSYGVQDTFYILAVLMLVPAPFIALWLRPGRLEASAAKGFMNIISSTFMQAKFWWLTTSVSLFGVAMTGFVVSLAPYLNLRGLDRPQAATFAGAYGVGTLLGRILGGLALDRLPIGYFGASALLANAISVLGVVLLPARYSVAAVLLFGLTEGGIVVGLPFCIARYFGLISYATIYSGILLVAASVAAVGPVLFSYLRDITGSYNVPFLMASGLSLAASFAWVGLARQDHGVLPAAPP